MENVTAYFVDASTGCSCCHDEDHSRGPYSNRESAEERVEVFRKQKLTASQYSKEGNYRITEDKAERFPDGRIVVEDHVFSGFWDQDNSLEERVDW